MILPLPLAPWLSPSRGAEPGQAWDGLGAKLPAVGFTLPAAAGAPCSPTHVPGLVPGLMPGPFAWPGLQNTSCSHPEPRKPLRCPATGQQGRDIAAGRMETTALFPTATLGTAPLSPTPALHPSTAFASQTRPRRRRWVPGTLAGILEREGDGWGGGL